MMWLVSLVAWLELIVVCAAFLVAQLAAAVTLPFDPRRIIVGRLARIAAVVGAKLHPLWKFRVLGKLPSPSPRRAVMVSNHRSLSDPLLIAHLPWEMKFLAKASLFRVPILGWVLRLAGDVPLVRGTSASAKRAMAHCATWLRRGVPVLIFPEGTRSTDGQLGPFKDGAFRLAIDCAAEVLPVAVIGTDQAIHKHDWRFGAAQAFVVVGKPIPTAGMTAADIPVLRDRARTAIQALLGSASPTELAPS